VTVLAELGVAGLALLVWLGVAASRALSDRRRPRAWTRAVIGAMLATAFVHSLLTGALMEDPIVWALLGVGCALSASGPARRPARVEHVAGPSINDLHRAPLGQGDDRPATSCNDVPDGEVPPRPLTGAGP
jgi:hypothetical protein